MPTPKDGYFLKDGTKVPGTTTLIGRFKDSGALIRWAGKVGYDQGYTRERFDLYKKRDDAGDIGTLVHAFVEMHLRGHDHIDLPTDTPPEHIERAKTGYAAFLQWEQQTQIKVVVQEIMLVSEKHHFGGTPDGIGQIGGDPDVIEIADGRVRLRAGAKAPVLSLIDWKSSNAVYSDHLIQVAAYKNLWEENFPDLPLNGGYHICRFSKEFGDFGHHFFQNLDEAWEQFLLFRRAYDIDKVLARRAK